MHLLVDSQIVFPGQRVPFVKGVVLADKSATVERIAPPSEDYPEGMVWLKLSNDFQLGVPPSHINGVLDA
jgi:hypothetical protein